MFCSQQILPEPKAQSCRKRAVLPACCSPRYVGPLTPNPVFFWVEGVYEVKLQGAVSCFVGKGQKDILYTVKLYACPAQMPALLHLAQAWTRAEGLQPPRGPAQRGGAGGADDCKSALPCLVKAILFSWPWRVLAVKLFAFLLWAVPWLDEQLPCGRAGSWQGVCAGYPLMCKSSWLLLPCFSSAPGPLCADQQLGK